MVQIIHWDSKTNGFELNSYDKCVANKMANGKQLTKMWHVDDCVASHMDEVI